MEQKYSSGMRWVLYILSFLIPLVGLIAGLVLMTKDDEESKQVGKNCLIALVLSIVLYFVCVICYVFGIVGLVASAGGASSSLMFLAA